VEGENLGFRRPTAILAKNAAPGCGALKPEDGGAGMARRDHRQHPPKAAAHPRNTCKASFCGGFGVSPVFALPLPPIESQ
jgi:hypothetical protein